MCNIAVFAAIGHNNDQAQVESTQTGEDTNDKSQVKQEAPDEAVVHVNAGNGYITYGGEKLDGKSGSFKANYAEPLTLTASANEGYELESVTVTGGGQTKTFTGGSFTVPADMVTNDLKVTLSTVKDESASKDNAATPIDGDKSDKTDKSDQNKIDKADENKTDTGKADIPEGTEGKTDENSGKTDEGKPEAPKVDENSGATAPEENGEGSSADKNTENNGATENGGNTGVLDGIKDFIDGIIGGDKDTEDADVETAAVKDSYTVKVGESIKVSGTENTGSRFFWWRDCGFSHKWNVSNGDVSAVALNGSGKSATVSFSRPGTYEIQHTYCSKNHDENKDHKEATETFAFTVNKVDPIGNLVISGPDSVTQFETITLTTNAKTAVTWTSKDAEVATVNQSGKVKGIAQGKATIVAETIDSDETLLHAEKTINVTESGENIRDAAIFFLNAPLANPDSNATDQWFPSKGKKELFGKVNLSNANWNDINTYDNVKNRVVAWPGNSTGTSWVLPTDNAYWGEIFNAYESKIEGELGVTLDQSDVEAIILHPYKISNNSDGIHLDCKVEMRTKGVITATFMLWDAGATGYAQYGDTIPYKVGTGESANIPAPSPELGSEKTVGGVTYKLRGWCDNEALTGTPAKFPVSTNKNVIYYAKYVPANQMITVNYYKVGTTKKVADSKNIDGLVEGQTVTERAIGVKGFTAIGPTVQTATAGDATEINFYYAPKTTSYSVHYYWNRTTESVADDKTVSDATVGSAVTESPAPVEGCTPVSNESRTIELKAEGNEITFYYYENVKLTANSDTVTYNGAAHNVSAFMGAPEGADFSAITVGASGTDAGTYAADFAEGTVGTVDASGKYIVAAASDGSLVINKRSVTLTSGTANKTYDSTLLTKPEVTGWAQNDVDNTGFVTGEVTDVKATGSVTNVSDGKVKNTITYTKGEKFKVDNYNIVVTEGELWIDPVTDEVMVTITGHADTKTYNGKSQNVEGYDVNISNGLYEQGDFTFTGTAKAEGTDVSSYTMGLNAGQFSNTSSNFSNVKFEVTDGKLEITPAELTVVTDDGSKPYDGSVLQGTGSITGWVNGEGDKVTVSYTEVGPGVVTDVPNNYTIDWNGVESGNYTINETIGKLSITAKDLSVEDLVSVSMSPASKKYDGTPLNANRAVVSAKDMPRYTFKVEYQKADGSWTENVDDITATNVSDTRNVAVRVSDPSGNFAGEKVVTFEKALEITKRFVVLVSESQEFKYDGTEHSHQVVNVDETSDGFVDGEGVEYRNFATIKDVGNKDNSFDFDLKSNTREENYVIAWRYGTLTVNNGAIADYVTLVPEDVIVEYDGEKHFAGEATATDTNRNDLMIEYQKSDSNWTTDRNEVFAVNVDDYKIVNVRVSSPKNYEGYVSGTQKLKVTPVAIELTANSKSREYNGLPLTDDGYKITSGKFVGEEGFESVAISGSQIDAGTSPNVITGYAFKENTKAGNYAVTTKDGQLEVTPVAEKVTVSIAGFHSNCKYDGTEHKVKGYRVFTISNELYKSEDFVFSGEAVAKGTYAGTYKMGLKFEQFENVNKNFSAVEFVIVDDGALEIWKRSVKLTSASGSKVYDGTPLVKNAQTDITVTGKTVADGEGFVDGEGATYTITGSQTEVGSSDNEFTYTLNEGTKAENYSIEKSYGTLTVTGQSVDPNDPSYKAISVSDPNDFVYDGVSHKWSPELKRADGTVLAEGKDYAVTYDTEDFVNVKTIKVTIEGKGNYSGKIEKSYQITKRVVVLASDTASKPYDGTPLTRPDVVVTSYYPFVKADVVEDSLKATGSITNVGSVTNEIVWEWTDAAKADNYDITKTEGTLTVTSKAIAGQDLTVGALEDVEYNGLERKQKPEVKDGDKVLTEGIDYELSYSEDVKNVGTVTVTVTGKGNYGGSVDVSYRIYPYSLIVTTDKASKTYDGEPLTAPGTISEFPNGETAAFEVVGSQTEVGSSVNAYVINWNGTAQQSNYFVIERLGTLTVTEHADEVVATAGAYNAPYDGKEHGVDVTVTGLPKGYTVKTALSNAKATDVTSGDVVATVDELVIVNKAGEDVTDKLKVTKVDGKITITPAELTVITKGATKAYDGTALTAGGSIHGLVNDETVDFKVTGSQTQVGSSDNTYELNWTGTAKESNYALVWVSGELTVTDRDIPADQVITKTHEGLAGDNQQFNLGDTVTFTITAKNIYAEAKTMTIHEIDGVALDQSVFENVQPGESVTATATYKIQENDVLNGSFKNIATVSFSGAEGTWEASDDVVVAPAKAQLTVTKKAVSEPAGQNGYGLDETIKFEVTVTNTGNVTVSGINIVDELPGAEPEGGVPESFALTPGQSVNAHYNYAVTATDIVRGYVENTATAMGTAPGGSAVKSESGKAKVNTVAPNARLKVTKETTSQPGNQNGYVQGETIKYKVTVENVGNMPVAVIDIVDELRGVALESGEISDINLVPGQKAEATFTYTVTAQDVTNGKVINTATATGNPAGGTLDVIPGTTEDPTYNPPAPTPTYENPSMVITKTASITSGAKAGDTITYNVTVRNNGDCDLTNVSIVDPLTGDKWNIDKLAVNATESFTTQPYTVTTADMKAGQVVNTATGTADNPTGKPTKVTPGTATTYIDKINASWTIDKSVTSTPANGSFYKEGEAVSYKIVVTNTGNVELTNIKLKDTLVDLGAQGAIDKLAPGESKTITYDYTVTAADADKGKIVNAVTGTAKAPDPVKPGGGKVDIDTGEDDSQPTPAPTPGPTTPGGTGGDNGTTVTPTTPVTPVTPVTPGVTETPSGETPIDANETPLSPADADLNCWVHWWIIVFMLLTLVYGCAVLVHRNGNSRELQEQQDGLLRKDKEQAQR